VHGIDAFTTATMWTLVWTSAVSWVLWGLALFYLASALLPAPGAPLASYMAAWSGSFLVGLIAIVSPAGLGAREEVMQVVLAQAGMSVGDILLVVVVARAWITLMDVVPALVMLAFRRGMHETSRASVRVRVS
jgi:uncharacterized membrane protein YbhN (UPF0104 family)